MILTVEGISKRFGGVCVLDDVGIAVGEGEIVGLIGPNGAGKSTLFSVVTGFLTPDRGRISLSGQDINSVRPTERARNGLVRTFQVPREFKHLTVRENMMAAAPDQPGENILRLLLQPRAVAAAEERQAQAADHMIDFLGLSAVRDQAAAGLSGGQKKLLELGRAMMAKPKVVLLDEPFAGVNPALVEQLIGKVRELNAEGVTFVVIEHDLQAVSSLVGRLYVLDQGRVIAEGAPAEVFANPQVRDAYLGGAA